MMPEYGFSCQQWCHCWRWNVFIDCNNRPRCYLSRSLYVWDAGAETRSSATADKLETRILIFVTQPLFHGYRIHVRGGPWRIRQTFLRPTDSWVGTSELGTADRCLATCLRFSVAHDTVAVHRLQGTTEVIWKLVHSVLCFHVFVFFPASRLTLEFVWRLSALVSSLIS